MSKFVLTGFADEISANFSEQLAGLRSLGPVWSRTNAFAHGVPFAFPASPDTGPGLTAPGRRLVRRCTMEGLSKARLLRRYRGRALSSERGYVGLLLRRAATLAFTGHVRSAAAIVLSLSVTVLSFAYGLAVRRG